MNDNKQVIFAISRMSGGGAERVISILANKFRAAGINTRMLLTSTAAEQVVRQELDEEIPVDLLREMKINDALFVKLWYNIWGAVGRVICKLFELRHHPVPAWAAYMSFVCMYRGEIKAMRSILIGRPDAAVIAFLQPTVPIVLLAARGLPNKIIISERADPYRLLRHRYGTEFIKRYYKRADCIVFQTEDAMAAYPSEVKKQTCVISNPIKADLPCRYGGVRTHDIVTFCRISAQKNLPLLLDAFARLHTDHPEYNLKIIGDPLNDTDRALYCELKAEAGRSDLGDSVEFVPFCKNVHELILNAAMYVNSSDYEGISNAMLESMAIGLPVICTDCPIGGARATISDGENGLLVPMNDSEALYAAMKRIIEDPALASRLSENAAKLRDELKPDNIAEKWMELL